MILWRISNYADLAGSGGLVHPGRWHNRGRPVVYLAYSTAGALLEALVHIEASRADELPRRYQLLEIEVPDNASIVDAALPDSALSKEGWQHDVAATRRYGDQWLAAGTSLLLRVPSAIVGRAFNALLNPIHAQARACRVISAGHYPFDDRLLTARR